MPEPTTITIDWFDESDYFTGPPLTDDMIQTAEAVLGYQLPPAYVNLLRVKNGGCPKHNCCPTQEPTGWADDHVEIDDICGLGGSHGVDSEFGSRYMIGEWGYPDVGVVIGYTPSAGPEAIILDYSLCGRQGEPRVIYANVETADGEADIVVLAPDFATFLRSLVDRSAFEVSGV